VGNLTYTAPLGRYDRAATPIPPALSKALNPLVERADVAR
jgi:hypothetical protein